MRSLFLALCVVSPLFAQRKPPAPPPPSGSPQAPFLNALAPAGLMRGTVNTLTITGTRLDEPLTLIGDSTWKVTLEPGGNATKRALKVDVPGDALVGVQMVRVVTPEGVSQARPISVDPTPTIVSANDNRTKEKAQPLKIPCVAAGAIAVETSAFYRIRVSAGQRLTFDVSARRIGSTLDPIVLLHDAKTGRELPGLYADDTPGLQTDARIRHTFKEAGDILVEVRDTTHRGGADAVYRLRIGDFPAVIAAFPLAAMRGTTVPLGFVGPDGDTIERQPFAVPNDPLRGAVEVSPKALTGEPGPSLPILVSDIPEQVEHEPNDTPAQAEKVNVPCGISGQFQAKGDRDCFTFAGKKGQKYVIQADTYMLRSPAEVYLVLRDAKNAEVAKSVPTADIARIEYTAVSDGELRIEAEHLNYQHGPNEFYHLTIRTPEPEVEVAVGVDRFETIAGQAFLVPIVGVTRTGYSGPVTLEAVGEGVSGTLTLPASVQTPATPAKGAAPSPPLGYLPVTVTAKAGTMVPFRVQAVVTVDGKRYVRPALAIESTKAVFPNLALLPPDVSAALAVCVTAEPKLTLTAELAPAIVGKTVMLTVKAKRPKGDADEIALTLVGLPSTITGTPKSIAKDASETSFPLTIDAKAAVGEVTFLLRYGVQAKAGDAVYAVSVITKVAPAVKDEPKKIPPKKESKS